jgi:esterase
MSLLRYQVLGECHSNEHAIVLLHGLFGMSDNLLILAKELAAYSYVVIPDLINHGFSPHRELMDYSSMAADVFFLMDDLNIDNAYVVGHSMGGKVAMQMASDSANRVKKLVVLDIAPVDYPPHHDEIFLALKQIAVTRITTRKQANEILALHIHELSLRQFFLKSLYRDENNVWRWRLGLAEIMAAYANICLAPNINHSYMGDVLFIKGGQSNYILPEHQPLIERWFPNSQFKIIQNAGHWIHAEKPIIVNKLIKRFLRLV